jgi:sterol desaturase/sphingolipid hydroxylase (fatty acid hydroxylase superfamily)
MDLSPVILSIPLYFLLIGLELLWEARKHKGIYRINDAITNISCGIASQISGALWGVLSIGMYQLVYQYASIAQIPVNLWSNLLLFLAVDFCYYWYHRSSHEVNFLWNTSHVVHHQSEDYNLSVALRQSSFGGVFSMLFYLPLAFMGFNTYAFLAVKGINLIYQFWIHTEAINKLPRWFEFIFNTPSHHRVHHGRNPKYIDRNHAGTLIIWDRMFGTFQEEEEKPTYGVTKPIHSWNPVWANVQPVIDMGRQFWQTPGWMNKIKVLFYKPGWQPAELGGYQYPPEIQQRPQKFNLLPERSLYPYLIVQFVLTLAITAIFLFGQENFTPLLKGLFSFMIIWTIVDLGMILEGRKIWRMIEIFRNLVLILACFLFFPGVSLWVAGLMGVLTVWFIWIIRK